jgi:hypothetical protein
MLGGEGGAGAAGLRTYAVRVLTLERDAIAA